MAEVFVVPPVRDGDHWRIRLRASDGVRWLATVSEAALAQELAKGYAEANNATLIPFDAEAWEAIRALYSTMQGAHFKALLDDGGMDRAGVQALRGTFEEGKQVLCKRFRKRDGRKVRCSGCPLQLTTGLHDCKGVPLRLAVRVAEAGGDAAVVADLAGVASHILSKALHYLQEER